MCNDLPPSPLLSVSPACARFQRCARLTSLDKEEMGSWKNHPQDPPLILKVMATRQPVGLGLFFPHFEGAIRVYFSHIDSLFTTGWWFGTFIIFPYIGNFHPSQLTFTPSFFRGVLGQPPTRYITKRSWMVIVIPVWNSPKRFWNSKPTKPFARG